MSGNIIVKTMEKAAEASPAEGENFFGMKVLFNKSVGLYPVKVKHPDKEAK